MNVTEKYFHGKINMHWNIPLSSLLDHLNGKIRSRKVDPLNVLTKEEDVDIIV
jgi:hypothetical protein